MTRKRQPIRGFLFTTLALLAFAFAGPQDFYPSGVGVGWVYSNGEEQFFSREQNVYLVLEHRFQGKTVFSDLLRYTPDGVYLDGLVVGSKVSKYNPPLLYYPKAPFVLGQEWGGKSTYEGKSVALLAKVLRIEGVTVPAGRFNAYVIRTSFVTQEGGSIVVERYFVPGVGIVRYATPDGGSIDLVKVIRP